MRQGQHPTKETLVAQDELHHRVIVPVFIPEVEGYFAHSLKILELCLDSLRNTAAGRVAVTIVSNGCCREANHLLDQYYEEGWIDQVLRHSRNIGKIEAIAAAARGVHEPLITFSDNDVLFRRGWLENVEALFNHFPECGIASPTPLPSLSWAYTASTVVGAYLRRELKFEKVVCDEDLDRFSHSINNPDIFRAVHKKTQLIVSRGNAQACVGCGHFVCTIRKELVSAMPPEKCKIACGGWSEAHWIDFPPDRLGYWRLATPRSYTYHMGNTPEPWMDEFLQEDEQALQNEQLLPLPLVAPPRLHWTAKLGDWTRQKGLSLIRRLRPYSSYK
jgi:cellulose synthase/poly-beta-1,6-N-acetylglucosamine synthase-like glycosyltransferase